jgi:hypothetical protein
VALRRQFGVSQRRACTVVGQPRFTRRLTPSVPSDHELALRAWPRDFLQDRDNNHGGSSGPVRGLQEVERIDAQAVS